MGYSFKINYQHLIAELSSRNIKHDIHEFPSGAIMVDVWHQNYFYVFQIESDFIGLSNTTENVSFDTIPDMKFFDDDEFANELQAILI